MEPKFYYEIQAFEPTTDKMGGYGFSINLDREFAKKALEKELTDAGYKNLIEIATSIIVDVGLAKKEWKIKKPYHFVPNEKKNLTCLLHFCSVPGNACDLGASWDHIRSLEKECSYNWPLEYNPHNVDSAIQAYALLSIWLKWVDLTKAFVSD